MTRSVVVAGVALDRAWPALGPAHGTTLRERSRSALAQVVQEAIAREAASIVVLGGLVSRATVVPETLAYAAAVLETFPGTVHVAPGPDDWWGGDGPYEILPWPNNMHFWSSANFEPAADEPRLWGSACTSSATPPPRLPTTIDGQARVLARAGLTPVDLEQMHTRDLVLSVPDLVQAPGGSGGAILVIDMSEPAVREVVEFTEQSDVVVDVVVDGLETTDELGAAITAASSGGGPVLVRLRGALAPRVLLPGTGGPDLAWGQVLEVDGLTYSTQTSETTDRSTRAEFLRAMAASRGNDRERHQTTALGLAALDASTGA